MCKQEPRPSITCPKCCIASYCKGDIDNLFCIKCGFHRDIFREAATLALPTASNIKLEVTRDGIKASADGWLLGLVKELDSGFVFTSEKLGSLPLPDGVTIEDVPAIVERFIADNETEWRLLLTKVLK